MSAPVLHRPMTDHERRALAVLASFDGKGLIGPQAFGTCLWPGKHQGSAPLARSAGKVLARLQRMGLALWRTEGACWGWHITDKGRRAIV